MRILSENKKAFFNYRVLEKLDAGISLTGQEVKSIKTRGVNLSGSYIVIKNSEAFWIGGHIPPYQAKNAPLGYSPERSRKLLLKKQEIKYLIGKSRERGLTFVPLKLYTTHRGIIKLEFAIAKGRKRVDKREVIKKKEIEREIGRELRLRG